MVSYEINAQQIRPAATVERAPTASGGAKAKPQAGTGPALPVEGASRLPPARPERAVLEQDVELVNQLMQSVRRELNFSIDDTTGRTVITVIDAETDEVIRQIPPERVVGIIAELEAARSSLLLNEST